MARKPNLQVIGVVGTFIGIIVAIILSNQEKPVRRLQVEVLSNSPLVSISSEVTTEIEILYKEQPVKSLSVILLKFSNMGNTPITEGDYSEPIAVSISPQAQVGEVTIQETSPEGIELKPIVLRRNAIGLSKALLNPGDQVVVRILALNNDGTLHITGRIAGINEIEVRSGLSSEGATSDTGPLVVMGVIIGGVIIFAVVLGLWNSERMGLWRKKRFGHDYDPARNHYRDASDEAFKGISRMEDVVRIVRELDRAITLDRSYLKKAEEDIVFEKIRKHEPYKEMLRKHQKLERI